MEITLKNLGPINEATFTVGDLTVICGKNNTGKTYITYATYGFLDYWQTAYIEDQENYDQLVSKLIKDNEFILPLDFFTIIFNKILMNAQNNFNKKIKQIFKGSEKKLSDSQIIINLENQKLEYDLPKNINLANTSDDFEFILTVDRNNSKIKLKILSNNNQQENQLKFIISQAIQFIIFEKNIPKAFISSAERTGAALFQREVDFTRSRLIDLLKETNINPQQLLGRFTAEYPLPVKHNIDFIRDLPNIIRKQSDFAQQHPEILQAFTEVAGGDYEVNQVGGINYSPINQPDLKLSLAESSSTVRSLVDIGFYLRHLAEKGDLLMIDEPELNLHPENQRKMARLIAMLVNAGIRVFITTHSDYIIKELNTLLLLNKADERLQMLAKREGYQTNELLKPEQLNIYMTTPDTRVTDKISYTLIPAKVTTESGIELTSFDETIEDINRIQDEIVWG